MSRRPKSPTTTEPTPQPTASREFADDTPEHTKLLILARDDQRAVKAARQAGEPIPATPNLDEFHRRYAEMTSTTKTKTATSGRSKGRADIRYFHDGRSMSETHKHKLSTLAYFHSHDIVAGSQARLSTKQFIAELAKLGVKDPGEPGWMVKLPNGVTVECRVDGEKSAYDGPAPTKKAASKSKATKATKGNGKVPDSLKAGLAVLDDKPAKPVGTVKKQTPGAKARAAAAATSSERAKADVKPNPKKKSPAKATTKKAAAPKRAPAKKTVAAARAIRKTTTKR